MATLWAHDPADLAPRRSGTPSPCASSKRPLRSLLIQRLISAHEIFTCAPPRTGTQPVRGQSAGPNPETHTRTTTARPPHPFLHRQGGAYLTLPPKDEGIEGLILFIQLHPGAQEGQGHSFLASHSSTQHHLLHSQLGISFGFLAPGSQPPIPPTPQ